MQNNIPSWIKAEQQQAEQQKAQQALAAQEALDTSTRIHSLSPAFWKELTEKLKENTDALPGVPNAHLFGSTSIMNPSDPRAEHRVRVQVANSGIDQVYTDFFYMPGSLRIRCSTIGGEQDDFNFGFLRNKANGLRVQQRGGAIMNAEQLAVFTVQSMANHVRKRRN